MKKMISIFLIVLTCLSLCACSSKEEEQDDAVKILSAFASYPASMPEFSVIDLERNIVTQDIFSMADLTVVNFWGTYCNPCVDELSELGKWAESMPDNVQIIGIVVDVESDESDLYVTAQQIVEKTGAKYQHLTAGTEFDEIITELVGVPTTFFVDAEGNMVGDPIVSTDVDGYKQRVEEYLNGRK